MKKIIVAGGRDFADASRVCEVCDQFFINTTDVLLTGGCSGADQLAHDWAQVHPVTQSIAYPADWDRHGKAAGPIRNRQMAKGGDLLIAFWDGKSRGTKNMIDEALKTGLEVHVYRY